MGVGVGVSVGVGVGVGLLLRMVPVPWARLSVPADALLKFTVNVLLGPGADA